MVKKRNQETCLDGKMEDNVDIISNVCMDGKSYTNLPLDVIYNVLLRLPIEDLMRSQGVCKTWRSLINESDFHHMQFKRALSQPPRILLAPYTRTGQDPRSSLYLMSNGKCKDIPVKGFELNRRYDITNSCNGLFCINTGGLHSPVYMYNPITGESTKLPEQDHEWFKLDGVLYGFGFDQVSKKYKVVCVYLPYYWDSDYYEGLVTEEPVTTGEIITEGEDSWRKLEFPYQIQFSHSRTVFLDGAFHWIISSRDYETSDSAHILVLDISTEQFRTINIPPSAGIPDSTILTDIAGSLTLVQNDSLETSTQIWRLVGSETGGRCIQQYSCEFVAKTDGVKYYCRVLGGCNDGSFLYKATDCVQLIKKERIEFTDEEEVTCFEVKASDHLAVYIPEKKQSFILQMAGAPDCFHTVFFKPTFVSPKSIYFPYKPIIPRKMRGWWSILDEMEPVSETEENGSDNEDLEIEWALRKCDAARKRRGRKGRRKKFFRKDVERKMIS